MCIRMNKVSIFLFVLVSSLVYQDAMKNNYIPTLKHLYNKLLEQNEPEAKSLAIKLELFTNGSLNIFAHETNVDIKSRILSFNIFNK